MILSLKPKYLLYFTTVFGATLYSYIYYKNLNLNLLYLKYQENSNYYLSANIHTSSGLLHGTPRDYCGCPLQYNISGKIYFTVTNSSLCSAETSLLGFGRKVISYSLYRRNNTKFKSVKKFLKGILRNLVEMRKIYPEWVMQLYSHTDSLWNETMCSIMCNNTDFYFCDVENIPVLGKVTKIHGRVWRFLILGDPTVGTFVSRDLDSLIGAREKAAVTEWENSNYTFHAMRDNPSHTVKIMAGMWGAKTYRLNRTYAEYLRDLISITVGVRVSSADQNVLAQKIYPSIRSDLLVHDSFKCLKFNDSVPFPVQRRDPTDFVGGYFGSPRSYAVHKPCPVECRPSYGKNWTFC